MTRSLSEVMRREERIYVTLPVKLRTGWGGTIDERDANTVDYSERGMRVRAHIPFQVGQSVVIVEARDGAHPANYSVVWVRDPVKGQPFYEAGLEVQRDRTN